MEPVKKPWKCSLKENIDEVILVGGSTRIPIIQKEVNRYLAKAF